MIESREVVDLRVGNFRAAAWAFTWPIKEEDLCKIVPKEREATGGANGPFVSLEGIEPEDIKSREHVEELGTGWKG